MAQSTILQSLPISTMLQKAAAITVAGDWSLWITTKVPVKKRLYFDMCAFFVPTALWWVTFERVLLGAARFPLWPLRPTSSKTYPATHRMVSLSGWFEQHHTLETVMSKQLTTTFNDAELSIIDSDGQQWLTAADISRALGYKSTDAATRLYNRNKAEFDDSMTWTVNLTVQGQARKSRVFNKRGCQLIGFLANTKKAAEFRKWALDVLEGQSPDRQIDVQAQNNHHRSDDTLWLCTQRDGQFIRQELASVANIGQIVEMYLPDCLVINKHVAAKVIEQTTEDLQRHAAKVATEAFTINVQLRTRLGLEKSQALVVGGAS